MNQTPLRRNRSYLALVGGYLATDFGSATVVFTLPLVVAASGASATAAGAVGFAYAAGNAVCLLPAGVHVDRSDRRSVMVASSSAVSLLFGSVLLAVLWADLTFTHLFAVAALAGMANAYMAPAEASALRMLLPAEQLGSALSVNQARQMAASLLAAPIGGMLLVHSELTLFGVVTAAFVAAACMIALIRVRLVTNAEPLPRTRWAAMSAGTRWLLRHPTIRTLVLASAAVNMALAGFTVCLVLGLQAGGMHPAVIGLLNTAAATAGLCGALLSPRLVNRMRTGTVVLAQGEVVPLNRTP